MGSEAKQSTSFGKRNETLLFSTTSEELEAAVVLSNSLGGDCAQEESAISDSSSPDSIVNQAFESSHVLPSDDHSSVSTYSHPCVTPDASKASKKTYEPGLPTPEEASSSADGQPCTETKAALPYRSYEENPDQLEGLRILSRVFLISSNALADQIKFLPDSSVPPSDLQNEHESMEEQLERLRTEFAHLLYDGEKQRANFISPPTAVIELLRGVWNLSQESGKPDRVGRKLVPVQSFYPNLLNHLLRSPGFPTVSGAFDSDIFRACGKKRVKDIECDFKQVIRKSLEEMGYSCSGQEIEFYLSFMKTKTRTIVQDPHFDFKHQSVDPWYVDESPGVRRKAKRGRRLEYSERVPFIAFFPLTPDGMAVEVWESRVDHRKGRTGVLVHIPFGSMMIARGDTVHAGGFSNSFSGNPRCHLYIYRSGGEVHDVNTSNSYTVQIDGRPVQLNELYHHGPGI